MSTDVDRTRPPLTPTGLDSGLQVTVSSAEETAALRRAVLRPHLTIEQMTLTGDQAPDTVYLAVRALAGAEGPDSGRDRRQRAARARNAGWSNGNGAIIGCVRLEPVPCPWADSVDGDTAWQLRAMATDPSVRASGVGRLLVEAAVDHVADNGGTAIWCNARVGAEGFYRRLGFHTVTDRFVVADVPEDHVGMVRALDGDKK